MAIRENVNVVQDNHRRSQGTNYTLDTSGNSITRIRNDSVTFMVINLNSGPMFLYLVDYSKFLALF